MLKKIHIFLPLLLSIPIFSYANDQQENLMLQQQVSDLFGTRQWDKLDNLLETYRTDLPKTSSGKHKLILAYSVLSYNAGDTLIMMADDWIAHNPKSPPAYIVRAQGMNSKATELRGEGDISTVDKSIFPKYNEILDEEKNFLIKHKSIGSQDPVWYEQMEVIARLTGDSKLLDETLSEGSDKYPMYQNLYLDALESKMPKWGGSSEKIEKVARFAVEKTKHKSGLAIYSYLWHNAFFSQRELTQLLFNHQIISWEDMKQGWINTLKMTPSNSILNSYLSNACLAQDKKTFEEVKPQLTEVEPNVWVPGTSLEKCVSFFSTK